MAKFQRAKRTTEIKYLQIYERRKRGWHIKEIADEFNVSLSTVKRAVQYSQNLALDLTTGEDIQLLIDAKSSRIRWLYDWLDKLRDGVSWEEVSEIDDGNRIKRTVKRGHKIYPTAVVSYLKEIRELEDDLLELQGLTSLATLRKLIDDVKIEDLTDKQVERIESGESILSVLTTDSKND